MSQHTAAWENRVAARREEDHQAFEADTAEARAAVQAAQTAFAARMNNIQQAGAAHWSALQQSFNNQVAAARQRAAELKAAHDLSTAQVHADDQEAYADIAAEFANMAAAEAAAAQREASEARAYAKSLEKTTA
jgi:hypothetical protein